MRGIVGICGNEPVQREKLLLSMRDKLVQREPDDAGFWRSPDGEIMLRHRHLSIIDLSPAGYQPMYDADECLQHQAFKKQKRRVGIDTFTAGANSINAH